MNAYTNLPLAARVAIPAVLVLLVGMIAYMTMLKPPAPITVLSTQDIGVFNTARTVLERNDVEFSEKRDKNTFALSVTPTQESTAAQALANSGVKDRTGMVKEIECPAPPGFTGTKAANTRANNCEAAKSVQGMLLSAGATAANVQVSQEENGTLLGPETSMNVVAQVFLPAYMEDNWNAEQAARAISRSVGTSLDRVSITDDELQSLFDGTSSSGKGAAGAGSSTISSSLGCGDIASATEIETKRAAVRNCYEGSIGDKLTELLGSSKRYVLTVEPTIDSVSRTTTTMRRTKGPISDRSSQSGSGQSVEDISSPPNSVEETAVNPAGDLSSLRINVTLDKNIVTEDQRLAVTSLLATYVSTKRGDPAPTVKMSQFDNGGGSKPDNSELEAIKTQAQEAAKGSGAGASPEFRTTTKTPTWMIALMVTLVLGIVAAIGVLWRRSSSMAAERLRLEAAFSNEQKLFENFAQQNPDDLATDLNALFGAPSAPERSF